jgi:apolipoprotein N-acyltransferase
MAYVSFVLFWITWEFIHHNWDLSWPWLTLGNVFATHPNWVQWYEFTGTPGGSLWVLLGNIFLFEAMVTRKGIQTDTSKLKAFIPFAALLLIPLVISYLLIPGARKHDEKGLSNVVVVQPNVEPYTEKFTTDPAVLVDKMITLSEQQLDSNTRLVIWPETAIPVQVWEHEISYNPNYRPVFEFVKRHPQIQLVSGIDSYKNWGKTDKKGFSIRTMENGTRYEAFNTAFATDQSGNFQLYHKSKLVPGVESLPSWLSFMSSIFDDLGGTTGSLGRSDSAVVFKFGGNPYQPAPIICYESIYSDYITDYVRRGANLLTVITNDGWWGETPGFRQHMNMSRLRAIENRRWVARSANTGISCFISPSGEVLQAQPWNKAAAIKMAIQPSEQLTFYSKNGDWISRLCWPLALLALILTAGAAIKNRKRRLVNQ